MAVLSGGARGACIPSAGATGDVSLTALEIAGNASVLAEWLDMPVTQLLDEFEITWVTDRSPGLVAVSFTTPDGIVRI